mmetsp:Transcript_55063/g.118956  ORF Transcript_55063/g.118956 Transcript_55063/m.118956 type:complete len:161 (+) Transcript_55063:98-580(+)
MMSPADLSRVFDQLDVNHDGTLSREEAIKFLMASKAQQLQAVQQGQAQSFAAPGYQSGAQGLAFPQSEYPPQQQGYYPQQQGYSPQPQPQGYYPQQQQQCQYPQAGQYQNYQYPQQPQQQGSFLGTSGMAPYPAQTYGAPQYSGSRPIFATKRSTRKGCC